MTEERDVMDVDVLFVGGGIASLSGALHLSNLINAHNKKGEGKLLAFSAIPTTGYFFFTSSKSASTTSSWALGREPSWAPGSGPAPCAWPL